MTTKSGNVITMSLWLKHLGNVGETGNVGRKLAILEPVARTVGKVSEEFCDKGRFFNNASSNSLILDIVQFAILSTFCDLFCLSEI